MKASAWGCVLRYVTKRGGRAAFLLLILGGLARPAEADLYSHLQSPDSGVSHALGTPIRVDFEANYQLGWGGNVTPYVGFGKATGDSGWTSVTGGYESGGDFGADSQWYGTMTPSATGTWYLATRCRRRKRGTRRTTRTGNGAMRRTPPSTRPAPSPSPTCRSRTTASSPTTRARNP